MTYLIVGQVNGQRVYWRDDEEDRSDSGWTQDRDGIATHYVVRGNDDDLPDPDFSRWVELDETTGIETWQEECERCGGSGEVACTCDNCGDEHEINCNDCDGNGQTSASYDPANSPTNFPPRFAGTQESREAAGLEQWPIGECDKCGAPTAHVYVATDLSTGDIFRCLECQSKEQPMA